MRRGELIAERYRLDERIGSGGMGVVWRATDTSLGRVVALKRSLDGRRIQGEANIGANLHHPNIITVFDTVDDDGEQWLVMEYLPSRSLADLVADGPLAPELAATVGAQIASALAVMHARGMVHRDVTPANVLVTDDGVAKLADLGLTRWADATRSGDAHGGGTVAYVAPEAISGEDGPPADVFSLGATLFDVVEGHSPWGSSDQGPYVIMRRAMNGEQERPVRAGLLAPVLTEMLRGKLGERPTAAEASAQLAALGGAAPAPVVSAPPPRRPRSMRSWGRKPLIALVAVIAVLIPVLVLTLGGDRAGAGDTGGQGSKPQAAGTVSDERAVDPCALLDASVLAQFGEREPLLDSEYGAYNRCGLVMALSDRDGDNVEVRLEFQARLEFPSQPLGKIGPMEVVPGPEVECGRRFALADGYLVRVTARNMNDDSVTDLCPMAQSVLLAAQARVVGEPVPERTEPLPADSLATTNACDTLTKDDLRPVLGKGHEPEPEFGSWTCYWGDDSAQVSVGFGREWSEGPGDDDTVRDIGSATAYVEEPSSDSEHWSCSLDLPRREYAKETETNPEGKWVEIVTISVDKPVQASSGEDVCQDAVELARAVVSRLPAV